MPTYRGGKARYNLGTMLGTGGFAQTWLATVTEVFPKEHWLVKPGPKLNNRVIIKQPNVPDGYTPDDARAFLYDWNTTFASALSALQRLRELSCVAHVYDYGHIDLRLPDGSHYGAFFLVEEYVSDLPPPERSRLSARIGMEGGRDVEEALPTGGDHRQAA